MGKLRLTEGPCLTQCHLGSARALTLSLPRMGGSQGYLHPDGAGPWERTKSTEDQDTCLFHELLEEQLASGRQRSSDRGEAGLYTGWPVPDWPLALSHPGGRVLLWAVTPSPRCWPCSMALLHRRGEQPLTPAFGAIGDQLTVAIVYSPLPFSIHTLFVPPISPPGECILQGSAQTSPPPTTSRLTLPTLTLFLVSAFPTQLGAPECWEPRLSPE